MEDRNVIGGLRALRQAEQIVGLLAVILGLQVFVTEATSRNDYPNGFPLNTDEEAPLTRFDASDGILLTELPATGVRIDTANTFDALMRVVSVGFIDAFNFYVSWHFGLISNPSGSAALGMRLILGHPRDKGEVSR
jgi:hypothetical protein